MKVWVAEGSLIWRITELEMHLETRFLWTDCKEVNADLLYALFGPVF